MPSSDELSLFTNVKTETCPSSRIPVFANKKSPFRDRPGFADPLQDFCTEKSHSFQCDAKGGLGYFKTVQLISRLRAIMRQDGLSNFLSSCYHMCYKFMHAAHSMLSSKELVCV